jgi:hypothetical protein
MIGMLSVVMLRWNTSAPGEIFVVECVAAQAKHAAVLRAVLTSIAASSTLCGGCACSNGHKGICCCFMQSFADGIGLWIFDCGWTVLDVVVI